MSFPVEIVNRRLNSILAIADTYAHVHRKDAITCRAKAMEVFIESLRTGDSSTPMQAYTLVCKVCDALHQQQ